MKIKNFIIFALLFPIMLITFFSCEKKSAPHKGEQLIRSPKFESGFDVRSLTTADGAKVIGQITYDKSSLIPDWVLAQWWSKFNIMEGTKTKIKSGVYKYADQTKELTIDYKNGQMNQKIIASNCYTTPRKASDMWLHLLCEQSLCGKFLKVPEKLAEFKINDLKELWFSAKFKLSYFEDKMDGKAKLGIHAAQYLCFVNLQNLSLPKNTDYGKLMHFGIPIFDNRFEYTTLYEAKDSTTPNFIYSLNSDVYLTKSFFKDGKPYGSPDNEWISVDFDILPYIKAAFEKAKSNGFLPDTTFEQLYLGAISYGWEVPGTYDAEMCVKDIGLYAVR